jgi:hypothetical protein
MAEKKEKKIVAAATGEKVSNKEAAKEAAANVERTVKEAAPSGSSTGYRIGAVLCWLAAFGLEIVALLILNGTISWTFLPLLYQLIIALVLDLVFVIVGAQPWKKANKISPASKKNPVKFWLWNNMGVIACVLAFVPFIILLLNNKEVDKKTKTIATVVAIIALLIGGVASYDFNPVSIEDKNAAIEAISGNVYWAPFGKVYHTSEDCQALNQSETLTYGTVEQAIEAGRTRLCAFCAKRDNIDGVVTDKSVDEVEVEDVQDNAA